MKNLVKMLIDNSVYKDTDIIFEDTNTTFLYVDSTYIIVTKETSTFATKDFHISTLVNGLGGVESMKGLFSWIMNNLSEEQFKEFVNTDRGGEFIDYLNEEFLDCDYTYENEKFLMSILSLKRMAKA